MSTQQQTIKSDRRNSISGVIIAKIDRQHLIGSMKALKIDYENDWTDEQLSIGAYQFFDKNTVADDLVQCDDCNGVSPEILDSCPYCGAKNETGAHETAAAVESEVVSAPKAVAKKPAKETTMTTTAMTTSKKKTNGIAAANGAAPLADAKALDKAVADIHKLQVDGAAVAWRLGHRVLDVYKEQLWKQRVDGEKQSYKTFEQFCIKEIDMTPTHAFSLMDVAEHFEESKVIQYGATKLSLVLQAPPQAQPKLLKQVEDGAQVRDLKKEVTAIKKKTGHRRPTREGAKANRNTVAASKARSEKAAASPKKEVTISKLCGRESVKLYCKPTTKKFEMKDLKPAKKLADNPYGKLELINGVTQEFFIQQGSDGSIKLTVVTSRGE